MKEFIDSLMYPNLNKKVNINYQIRDLESRVNRLVHVKAHTKTIDLDLKRIDIEFKIDKINLGFSKFITFDELKDLDKLESSLKKQFTSIILMYFNLK